MPWQYLPRLGIHLGSACYSRSCHALCYYISCRALAVCATALHLFYILSCLQVGSICPGLACYFISCRALAESAGAWHAVLYHGTPWQYLPRFGMPFYILSHLGSIRRGLVCCYSMSCHALAVSAEAWNAFFISFHALAVSAEGPTFKNPSYESPSSKKSSYESSS